MSDASIYALDNAPSITSLFTRPNVRPNREPPQTTPTSILPPKVSVLAEIISEPTYSEDPALSPLTPVKLNFNIIITKFDRTVAIGDRSNMVIVLQKVLTREKLFDHSITGYFGPITEAALAQFQLKYNLIDSLQHPAA